MVDDKGQIHTIEGFTAAFILIVAMVYGVQSVAITPTSSSTASQEVELNNYKLADDVLSTTNANGELREGLLNWSASEGEFVGSQLEATYYAGTNEGVFGFGGPVPGDLGETLNYSLTERGIAYNIELSCADSPNSRVKFADNGDPSEHSVTASTMVTLYEHDLVESSSGPVSLAEVSDDPDLEFYCDRLGSAGDHSVYNSVEVTITIWRM